MTVVQNIAHAFQMTDAVWQRHTNPWSVWTRYASLPLLIVAIWSRVWLGWGGDRPGSGGYFVDLAQSSRFSQAQND